MNKPAKDFLLSHRGHQIGGGIMNSNGKTDKNLLLIVIAIIALVFVTNCLLSLILL